MKKGLWILVGVTILMGSGSAFFTVRGNAGSTRFLITVPDQEVVKGEEFAMDVHVSGSAEFDRIDAYISYDAEKAEFVSDGSDKAVTGASGILHIAETFTEPVRDKTYQIKMRAIEIGNADFSITDGVAELSENGEAVQLEKSLAIIRIGVNKTDSMEVNLSSLEVYPGQLDPIFHPEITEYQVRVEKDVKELVLSAVPIDPDSVVTIEGNESFISGSNKIVIKVSSASGVYKEYKLSVIKA